MAEADEFWRHADTYRGHVGLRNARLEQFQEKCGAVFRPEVRKNNRIELFSDSVKR
ncbi:MAG: hypothetical protein QM636_00300 [Rhizobium sp.]